MPATTEKPVSGSEANSSLASPFRILMRVFGSTTAFTAFLLFFGFISQGALYRYMGMPRIESDTIDWIEYGAQGLIDTVNLAISYGDSPDISPRPICLFAVFWLLLLTIWALCRNWHPATTAAPTRWARLSEAFDHAIWGRMTLTLLATVTVVIVFLLPRSKPADRITWYAALGLIPQTLIVLCAVYATYRNRRERLSIEFTIGILGGSVLTLILFFISVHGLAEVLIVVAIGTLLSCRAYALRSKAGDAARRGGVTRHLLWCTAPPALLTLAYLQQWRAVLLIGAIAALLLGWLYGHRQPFQYALRSPFALLAAHVLTGALLAYLAYQAFAIAAIGSDLGRDRLKRRVQASEASLIYEEWQREKAPDKQASVKTPALPADSDGSVATKPDMESFARTVLGDDVGWLETLGPDSMLRELAQKALPLPKSDDGDAGAPASHLSSRQPSRSMEDGSHFPTRPQYFQSIASELYGWYTLTLLLAALAVALVWHWRRWLLAERSDSYTPEALTEPRERQALGAVRVLATPALLLLLGANVLALPALHGLLATPSLGYELVIVNLRQTTQCAPAPAFDWIDLDKRKDIEDADRPRSSRAEIHTRPGVKSNDDASGIASARVGTAAADGYGPYHPCTAKLLADLNLKIEAFANARRNLAQVRPAEQSYPAFLAPYQAATDDLFDSADRLRCPEAFQRVFDVAPLRLAPSDASDYFWQRWQEYVNLHGQVRAGYLLTYPSSGNDNRLVLFYPTRIAPPWGLGMRWNIAELRRDCADQVVSNPAAASLEQTIETSIGNPNISDLIRASELNPGPLVARWLRYAFSQGSTLSPSVRGLAITALGTVTGQLGMLDERIRHDFGLTLLDDARTVIHNTGLLKTDLPIDKERIESEFTALHFTRDPYVAWRAARWLRRLKPSERNELRKIRTAPTTFGLMMADFGLRCRELAASVNVAYGLALDCGDAADEEALSQVAGFDQHQTSDWLADVAGTANEDWNVRASACTALGESHTRYSLAKLNDLILAMAKAAKGKSSVRSPIVYCVSGLWSGLTAKVRVLLDDWIRNGSPFADDAKLRRLAIDTLHRNGFVDQDEGPLLVRAFIDRTLDSTIRARAAYHFDEIARDAIVPALLACAEDNSSSARQNLCLQALTLTMASEDGDEDSIGKQLSTAERVAQLAKIDVLKAKACSTLNEFVQRGGKNAADAVKQSCKKMNLSSDFDARWEGNYEEIAGSVSETSASNRPSQAASTDRRGALDAAIEAKDNDAFVHALAVAYATDDAEAKKHAIKLAQTLGTQEPFRDVALKAALHFDSDAPAQLVLSIYFGEPASLRVLTAAQYLENLAPEPTATRLLDCAAASEQAIARRLRCMQGLPLLDQHYAGSSEQVARLQTLAAPPGPTVDWHRASCAALGEWKLRVDDKASTVAHAFAADCSGFSADWLNEKVQRKRWLWHLLDLTVALRGDASAGHDQPTMAQLDAAILEAKNDLKK